MLSKQLANDLLNAALSTGGDFAEIFAETKRVNSILMVNSVVEKTQAGIDNGVGIRIFHGTNAVYSYTTDMSPESLMALARSTAAAVKAAKNNKAADFTDCSHAYNHEVKLPPDEMRKKEVIEIVRPVSEAVFAYSREITQTKCTYGDVTQDVLIANSEGVFKADRRTRVRMALEAIASSANEKQTAFFGPGAQSGFEFIKSLNMKELAEEAAHTAVTMLHAGFCPSGKMPVIIDNGFGGVIFHEACGHSLEATSISKDASVFCGKMNQQIASPIVTAIDDGTIPNAWGSMNIDDEGAPMRKNILIENGILKSYLVDKLGGLRMGMPSTGSGRRESYRFAPTSRMTNTFIAAGTDKKADIFTDTEYGLYAKKMGGGSVEPSTGDFNFAVTEAYIVRNGKICEPVRGATLIGRGSEVLMNIDRVSDNLARSQGMCGSASGSIPTDVGQPLIRVKEILVGGRGGNE